MLTDFGVSTQAKQSLSRVSNQEKDLLSAGTISYMAPERFSKQNLPIMANDIYSLGSTVFEMLSGMLPFGNDGGLLQKKGAEIPELPGNFSPLLKRTLEKCLEAEPWARPTANRLEDIANEAIMHPETRNRIPDVFAATSQDEVPQSQLNAATPPGATVLGPAIEELINKGTVMGPALSAPVKGTVIGSGSSYNSANPYNNSLQPQDSSKKGLWIGIAIVVVLALGAGAYFLFGQDIFGTEQTETAINPAEQQKMQEQAEYESALALFNQENPDSIQLAFNRMKTLAENGNKDAIFEVAKTYARIPNDIESDRRKRLLGWTIVEEDGPRKGSPASEEINREAIVWLEKAIQAQVPNYHQCLYWLSSYYYLGIATQENTAKSKQLLKQAKDEAEKNQDFVYKEKIEKTLELMD